MQWDFVSVNDDQRNTLEVCCLQVEKLSDGVAVDSLDTHCCDRLCACSSGYFCHRLINDKSNIFS